MDGYANVKTDRVDSQTLTQILLLDHISESYKISNDKLILRDALRARRKIDPQHTTVTNSILLFLSKYNDSAMREKNKQIAKSINAKEIAKIVYHVPKNNENYNKKFKSKDLEHTKSLQLPRVVNTYT